MKRARLATVLLALLAAVAVGAVALRSCGSRSARQGGSGVELGGPPDPEAIARLERIPLYRPLARSQALRAGHVDRDGTLHVVVDLRAYLEPRLAASGLPGTSELFPATARGTIATDDVNLRETWSVDGPAGILDVFDRDSAGRDAAVPIGAIPGTPSAVVRARLNRRMLADPQLGGAPLAAWRDRVEFAEKLLGRPLRAEIAEDLAGPAVFALYEGPNDSAADAIAVFELRRSDRLAGLLELVLSLGALTERATVRRYRGVATGSFVPSSGRSGLALAIDGPILMLATSRARLESAIDARRAVAPPDSGLLASDAPGASWQAVSTSGFVRHGWARLSRSANETRDAPVAETFATLWPEGSTGWRLEGRGPSPAITADPVLPFFRSVLGGRQRGAD